MAFREQQLVILVADLARFTPAVAGMDAVAMATLVDRFYTEGADVVTAAGGRVVKYLGDAFLAVFPPDLANDAVGAAERLGERVAALRAELGVPLENGVNIHMSTVAEGEFGVERQYDIVGNGVIHAFRMGAGAGIRISEPVYRKLPSERRSAWQKHQPPATYTAVAR